MTIDVSVVKRKCDKCHRISFHKIEYHYYPEKKVIKECASCGKTTTICYNGDNKNETL